VLKLTGFWFYSSMALDFFGSLTRFVGFGMMGRTLIMDAYRR
jgi:hypothetical protein